MSSIIEILRAKNFNNPAFVSDWKKRLVADAVRDYLVGKPVLLEDEVVNAVVEVGTNIGKSRARYGTVIGNKYLAYPEGFHHILLTDAITDLINGDSVDGEVEVVWGELENIRDVRSWISKRTTLKFFYKKKEALHRYLRERLQVRKVTIYRYCFDQSSWR